MGGLPLVNGIDPLLDPSGSIYDRASQRYGIGGLPSVNIKDPLLDPSGSKGYVLTTTRDGRTANIIHIFIHIFIHIIIYIIGSPPMPFHWEALS
jgi:hypothetical protein